METKTTNNNDHLVDLEQGWLLWKSCCLRGAGFPVQMLDEFRAKITVIETEVFFELEQKWQDIRDMALQLCRDATRSLDIEARRHYRKAIRLLKKGRIPEPIPGADETVTVFRKLAQAMKERDAARMQVEQSFFEDRRRISINIRKICHNQLFREAIIWQNRHLIDNSIDVLIRKNVDTLNSDYRKHEEAVFNYIQRYCAKNDTIGFFGPAGWANFSENGPVITLEPGPGLVNVRRTYFEYWAIETLAGMMSKSQDVLPWLAPRCNPQYRVGDDGYLHQSGRKPVRLRSQTVQLLISCDGETRAIDIAVRLGTGPKALFSTQEQVLETLGKLANNHIIFWNAHVPIVHDADRRLQRIIEQIDNPAVSEQWATSFAELQEGKARIEASCGNAEQLNAAMKTLESTFQRITGTKPTRHDGKVYGGRTLVYEDCCRDLKLVLGPEIRHSLGVPLTLVLRAANSCLHVIRNRFSEYLADVYTGFQSRTGGRPVSFDAMVMRNQEVMRSGSEIVEDAVKQYQKRWLSIFNFDENSRHIELNSDDIHEQVFEAFPDVPVGWPMARYHSPDLMIAAESAEDISQGRYQLVMGEFNAGINRLVIPLLTLTHDNPGDITRFIENDLQRPLILAVPNRHGKGHRAVIDTLSTHDYHLAIYDTPSWRAGSQVLNLSELIVTKSGRDLTVQTRDGRHSFHITEFFLILLHQYWLRISMLPPLSHNPRITIDNLVVVREQWCFPCREVTFANLPGPEERFIGARRMVSEYGMPRYVFARVPFERKPYCVDFENPLSVDSLAKVIRRGSGEGSSGSVALTEMLPRPEQCWLTDIQGNRYTSELRLAIVNSKTWHSTETSHPD